jgi:hypothetical protein
MMVKKNSKKIIKKAIEFSMEWVARNSKFVWVVVCN